MKKEYVVAAFRDNKLVIDYMISTDMIELKKELKIQKLKNTDETLTIKIVSIEDRF